VGDGGKGLVVILYPGRVNLKYYQNTLEIPVSVLVCWYELEVSRSALARGMFDGLLFGASAVTHEKIRFEISFSIPSSLCK